jgi:hypothetical protein
MVEEAMYTHLVRVPRLRKRTIDLAFVPYRHLLERHAAQRHLGLIGAATVVAMHHPADDAPLSSVDPASDLRELLQMVENSAPGVVMLPQVLDSRVDAVGAPQTLSNVYRGCSQLGSNA